jgi:hypothetical protein
MNSCASKSKTTKQAIARWYADPDETLDLMRGQSESNSVRIDPALSRAD